MSKFIEVLHLLCISPYVSIVLKYYSTRVHKRSLKSQLLCIWIDRCQRLTQSLTDILLFQRYLRFVWIDLDVLYGFAT